MEEKPPEGFQTTQDLVLRFARARMELFLGGEPWPDLEEFTAVLYSRGLEELQVLGAMVRARVVPLRVLRRATEIHVQREVRERQQAAAGQAIDEQSVVEDVERMLREKRDSPGGGAEW